MERTEELFDRIERYLNNTLSEEERNMLELQMQTDEALAIEVAKHRELHEILGDKQTLDFRNKINKIHQEVVTTRKRTTKTTGKPATSKTRFPYKKLAIAAILVVGLGVLFWDHSKNTNTLDLYTTYYKPYPVDDTKRGEIEEELANIYTSYEQGAYVIVISALEKQLEQVEKPKLRLYLGNSYLRTDQEQKAATQFRKIDRKSVFYEDAQWYLALTYLKLQVQDSTRYFLENVIDYKGIHQKTAKKILDKLQ